MVRVSASRVGAVAGVLVAVAGVGLAVDHGAAPEVDEALAAAVSPVIDEHLEQGPWPGLLSTARPELGPRWFCEEQVVEIRRTGDDLRVGVTALCEEYARDGATLFTGSGEHAAKIVDLAEEGAGYRVTGVKAAPDGVIENWWLTNGLSEAGVRHANKLLRAGGGTTAPQARQAFGLPDDAPVRDFRP
jgi:hypothetical protein